MKVLVHYIEIILPSCFDTAHSGTKEFHTEATALLSLNELEQQEVAETEIHHVLTGLWKLLYGNFWVSHFRVMVIDVISRLGGEGPAVFGPVDTALRNWTTWPAPQILSHICESLATIHGGGHGI